MRRLVVPTSSLALLVLGSHWKRIELNERGPLDFIHRVCDRDTCSTREDVLSIKLGSLVAQTMRENCVAVLFGPRNANREGVIAAIAEELEASNVYDCRLLNSTSRMLHWELIQEFFDTFSLYNVYYKFLLNQNPSIANEWIEEALLAPSSDNPVWVLDETYLNSSFDDKYLIIDASPTFIIPDEDVVDLERLKLIYIGDPLQEVSEHRASRFFGVQVDQVDFRRVGYRFGDLEHIKNLMDAGASIEEAEHDFLGQLEGMLRDYFRELLGSDSETQIRVGCWVWNVLDTISGRLVHLTTNLNNEVSVSIPMQFIELLPILLQNDLLELDAAVPKILCRKSVCSAFKQLVENDPELLNMYDNQVDRFHLIESMISWKSDFTSFFQQVDSFNSSVEKLEEFSHELEAAEVVVSKINVDSEKLRLEFKRKELLLRYGQLSSESF